MAAGAAAVIGAGASYAGSKKQSDAAKKGANLQMQQFQTLNQQQQPYIQSGYGAMGRLNTLLGLGGGGQSMGGQMPTQQYRQNDMYQPTPNGGMQQVIPSAQQQMPGGNQRLAQLLQLRAQHGDTEAARILGSMQ